MIEVQLEPEMEARLEKLAAGSHVTKSFFAREAILRMMEDREDYLMGIAALSTHTSTVSLEEMERRNLVEG